MNLSFVSPLHLKLPHPRPSHPSRPPCYNSPTASLQPQTSNSLYKILGINEPNPETLPVSDIRRAYLILAKQIHPDTTDTTDTTSSNFQKIAYAWSVLSDPHLRSVYHSAGEEALLAIDSIHRRADQIEHQYGHVSGDQLDYLSDTGQLVGHLLCPDQDAFDPSSVLRDDACPRSVEEAVWNIQHHEDRSVRYYGLWWIYKFKVSAAESALINVLRTSSHQTSLGGFGLRRRAALALGAVASFPTATHAHAVEALADALRSRDYFLRYRAAEALANVAQRATLQKKPAVFPQGVMTQLKLLLKKGAVEFENLAHSKSGYSSQEGLFDLDALDLHVRQRLEKVFEQRRRNEDRSRRTTMTPQLGVDQVGSHSDEPYEWILKAVSAISSHSSVVDPDLIQLIRTFTDNDIPLVRYAAYKALYNLTQDTHYADKIVQALQYGEEHHYSQRVLIRDLGDLGYCQGAAAVATCPMVENSFKILALKNMLAKENHDSQKKNVQYVLAHMDSLL